MKRVNVSVLAVIGLAAVMGCTSGSRPVERAEFLREQGLEGAVALIEFGVIGCEVSHEGLLKMQRMQAEEEIPNLRYLRVEASGDGAKSEAYLKDHSITVPVFYDASTSAARSFEATAYPTFVLIDKVGRVRYRGAFPPDELASWVEELSGETIDPEAAVTLFGVEELDIPDLLSFTQLPDTSGAQPKPLSDYLGRNGIMLLFVDTECPYAGQVIKQSPAVTKTLAMHEIPVVLINIDQDDKPVMEFYSRRQTGTAVIYDTTTQTQEDWGVSSVPTVLLISSNNQLLYKGSAVWQNVASALEVSLGLQANSILFSERGTEYG